MDSTLVDQCRKDHTESRRGHIDLQKSPSSSYRSDKVKQWSVSKTTEAPALCPVFISGPAPKRYNPGYNIAGSEYFLVDVPVGLKTSYGFNRRYKDLSLADN